MKTTLTKVDPQIVDDKDIEVTENNIRNARLHRCLVSMSKLLLFVIKCDSNNTSGTVKPSDSIKIRQAWNVVREDFAFHTAPENDDLPTGDYEFSYQVLVPHPREIQRMTNQKTQEVVAEISSCLEHCLGVDSANTQGHTSPADAAMITKWLDFVERAMDRYIGEGKDINDTGIKVPMYTGLGTIEPSVNASWAQKLEHSKEAPVSQHESAGGVK